jgi:S-formylglutathione hydrolase FrmB
MALIQADLFSQSLGRTVTINAVIPCDKMYFDGIRREVKPFKTLYLLHGIFGNYTDWITGTRIQRWAQDRNLAVIMPSGENKFYVDNEKLLDFGSKFIEELVYVTRDMFNLSHKREDTFIAGLSMGGYGAITNGLKYDSLFSHIAGLSSAMHIDDIVNADNSDPIPFMRRNYLESVFGNLGELKGSDKDPYFLAEKRKESEFELPEIYLCCGDQDSLFGANEKFKNHLEDLGYPVTWMHSKGGHEWDFWDEYILKILEWLPLDEKEEAVSSGNVGV